MKEKWIRCPVCGNKTRDRIREDTVLKNYLHNQNIHRMNRVWFYFLTDFVNIGDDIFTVRKIAFSPHLVINLIFRKYLPFVPCQ